MKSLTTEFQDTDALCDLGRASVQIVHDLKNQLNGLKLYATFLRKRLEKADRPADELETIAKLIAGLERAANDTAVMVRYGRPLELRRAPRVDLSEILTAAVNSHVSANAGIYEGDFDAAAVSEAFQSITIGAQASKSDKTGNDIEITLCRDDSGNSPFAVVEWHGVRGEEDEDLFLSFAGSSGLRMALAAKIIRMHGGDVAHDASVLRARLPLDRAEVRG
ncbi:MAG: hypothetical protein M3430_04895 [Acidobacteriota bacterium]|nr:hypothetical protein [Acidobacteriota bacterium]